MTVLLPEPHKIPIPDTARGSGLRRIHSTPVSMRWYAWYASSSFIASQVQHDNPAGFSDSGTSRSTHVDFRRLWYDSCLAHANKQRFWTINYDYA